MTAFAPAGRHEPLVEALAAVLAERLPPFFARERAAHLATSLIYPPDPGDHETVWSECLQVTCWRRSEYPHLRVEELERLTVRCMVAFLRGTGQVPSRLALFAKLRAWAVPERWLVRLNELDADRVQDGAA